jgi:hypothetical protein
VKPIIKPFNYSHLFPTRYASELKTLHGVVSPDTSSERTQHEDVKKTIKEGRCENLCQDRQLSTTIPHRVPFGIGILERCCFF